MCFYQTVIDGEKHESEITHAQRNWTDNWTKKKSQQQGSHLSTVRLHNSVCDPCVHVSMHSV